jgi:antirestriction protein ArdC
LSYQGINVWMLWAKPVEKGFAAPIWMTFKQALELGGHVRKGEKGSLVVYASSFTRTGSGKTNFAIIAHEMKRHSRDEELARMRGR